MSVGGKFDKLPKGKLARSTPSQHSRRLEKKKNLKKLWIIRFSWLQDLMVHFFLDFLKYFLDSKIDHPVDHYNQLKFD